MCQQKELIRKQSSNYPSSESRAIDELSIVSNSQRSVRCVHHKRLTVDLFGGGARRVARVAYAEIACENAFAARRSHICDQKILTFQLLHSVFVKDIVDQAHSLVHVKLAHFVSLGRHNSRTFLTPANGIQLCSIINCRLEAIFSLK